ncbi:hypothetical protein ACTDI4_06865 [Mesorhizobium sp. PUT5]|uniref:hypothetical protein n=1 Tax=Mesorhizobium sp. PUT5 TaxID=3454629 RepID=UPI003FA4255C
MFRTIAIASILALGLSGAAMAQHGGRSEGHGHHGHHARDNGEVFAPDQTITGSIFAPDEEYTGPARPTPLGPCAYEQHMGQGAYQAPTVNDHYCGK